MQFHVFNIERCSDTEAFVYGKFAGDEYTPIATLRVTGIISPVYFLPTASDKDKLITDLKYFTTEILEIEEVHRTNIFFKSLGPGLDLLKIHFRRHLSFEDFESDYCELVLSEFTNPVENLIISKGLRGPCLVRIGADPDTAQGITIDCTNSIVPSTKNRQHRKDREGRIIVDFKDIEYVGSCKFGSMRLASMALECRNGNIMRFAYFCAGECHVGELTGAAGGSPSRKNGADQSKVICSEISKGMASGGKHSSLSTAPGSLSGVTEIKHSKFSSSSELTAHLNGLIGQTAPDILVYHNLHSKCMLRLREQILCDIFEFACANIAGKDFSIQEIASHYGIASPGGLVHNALALVQIFERMDALSLAKEMAEISGYLVNRCLGNCRSERIEYTLLHELYGRCYLFPPANTIKQNVKYTGGLVLEPVLGFYEDIVLLLDFNSLYPSIIQEFNVCFSTVGLCDDYEAADELDLVGGAGSSSRVCARSGDAEGFLPKILKSLVKRRRSIKELLKSCSNEEERSILNVRQRALKLTANSIYGCLGSPMSRFCNYRMAAFITAKGRELLCEARAMANSLGLHVIYGDTDSLMIHTKYPGKACYHRVALESAQVLVQRINAKYRSIEIETEKAFKKLLLYSKKKYGVLVFGEGGSYIETRGLDMNRRDFCQASTDLSRRVLDIILEDDEAGPAGATGGDREMGATGKSANEEKAERVYKAVKECAADLQRYPPGHFIIHSALSKDPAAYAQGVAQAHVSLALRLQTEKGIAYRQGDVISYIIGAGEGPITARAFHPDERFSIDYNYYIKNQILPPLLRLISLWTHVRAERVELIFGVENSLPRACGRSVTFVTACCGCVQEPALACARCAKSIPPEFYAERVSHMLGEWCTRLYQAAGKCPECEAAYTNHMQQCHFCNKPLEFPHENREFDEFLKALEFSFKNLNIGAVNELCAMYSGMSSYRTIDLMKYFKNEILEYDKLNLG